MRFVPKNVTITKENARRTLFYLPKEFFFAEVEESKGQLSIRFNQDMYNSFETAMLASHLRKICGFYLPIAYVDNSDKKTDLFHLSDETIRGLWDEIQDLAEEYIEEPSIVQMYTDIIFVKEEYVGDALSLLTRNGYAPWVDDEVQRFNTDGLKAIALGLPIEFFPNLNIPVINRLEIQYGALFDVNVFWESPEVYYNIKPLSAIPTTAEEFFLAGLFRHNTQKAEE